MTIYNRQPILGLNYSLTPVGTYPSRGGSSGPGDFIGELRLSGYNFEAGLDTSGQAHPISQNTALFSIMGTTFGGDGRTTFDMPDLEARVIYGSGRGPGLGTLRDGEFGGTPEITLTQSVLPSSVGGGAQSITNEEPHQALTYLISTSGTFPSSGSGLSVHGFLGQIKAFAGNFAPGGWAIANGDLLNIAGNEALFTILGTTYGGDGVSTFGLPDLRGRAAIGAGQGPGLNNIALGQKLGTEWVTLTDNNMPNGAGQSVDNYGPSLAINYFVITAGIFPSMGRPLGMEFAIGEIVAFAGNFAPRNAILAHGQLLSIADNQALFSLYGTSFGGDGRTTFGVPDLRGRAPVDEGTYSSGGSISLGEKAGTSSYTVQFSDLPAVATPVITSVSDDNGQSDADGITNDTTLFINGTIGTANAGITILLNMTEIGTTTADGSGNWRFDHTGVTLADGDYRITAVGSALGNFSATSADFDLTIDTRPPSGIPTITNIVDDSEFPGDFSTTDATLVFNGTAAASDLVEVLLGATSLGVVSANSSGEWSLDYTGTAISPGVYDLTARKVDVAGNLGPSSSATTLTIIAPFVDPSATGLPTTATVVEDVATGLLFNGMVLADSDSAEITLTLQASAGLLISAGAVDGVTQSGSGSGTLTLTGSVAALNAILARTEALINYQGASNVNGSSAATISVSANDGRGDVALGDISLDITPVNDAPTGTLPATITMDEEASVAVDLSSLNVADVDDFGNLTLTLTATGGTLRATPGMLPLAGAMGRMALPVSAEITAISTTQVQIVGTAAVIANYFANTNAVQFTGDKDVFGAGAGNVAVAINDSSDGVFTGDIAINITNVNDAPTATLPATITMDEEASVAVDLSSLNVADVDEFGNLTLTLTATGGTLSATPAGIPLGRAAVPVGPVITAISTTQVQIVGTAAVIANYFANTNAVQFTGDKDVFGTGAGNVAVAINDSSDGVFTGDIAINITNVNDAPTGVGVSISLTAVEDTAVAMSIQGVLGDVDEIEDMLMQVVATNGVISATASVSSGISVAGSGTGTVTLTGTVAELNAYLATGGEFTYQGPSNVFGPAEDTINVYIDDNDGSGRVNFASTGVAISAVNDLPTGVAPSAPAPLEDTLTNLDLSGMQLADIDSTGSLTVVLSVSAGTFRVNEGGIGLSISGSHTDSVRITGSIVDLTNYLETADRIAYAPPANANGNVGTFSVSLIDGAESVALGTQTITVTPVNDAPTATLPATITVDEEASVAVDLSSLNVADVDDFGNLTLTLTSTGGTLRATPGMLPLAGAMGRMALPVSAEITAISTTQVQIVGTAAVIANYLANTNAVQFTGDKDVFGAGAGNVAVAINDSSDGVFTGDIAINITNVNDAPTATLPATITVDEEASVAVDLSSLNAADVDELGNLTLTLTATGGTLSAAPAGIPMGRAAVPIGPVITAISATQVQLVGTAGDIANYLANTNAVRFTGDKDVFGTGAGNVAVAINDSSDGVFTGDIAINITNVNDAPVIGSVPISLSAIEDVASTISLGGITVVDADGDDPMTMTLSVTKGALSVNAGLFKGVTVSGSGSATLTLTGITSHVLAALDRPDAVQYQASANANGTNYDTLSVSVDDLDGSGTILGGNIAISVSPINDAPTGTGLPAQVLGDEDKSFNVDLSAVTISDVDEEGTMLVTLRAAEGTFEARSSDGISVVVKDSGATVELTGTSSKIEEYLDTISSIKYLGAQDDFGTPADTITVTLDDLEGGQTTLGVINVDLNQIDEPVIGSAPTGGGLFTTGSGDDRLSGGAGDHEFNSGDGDDQIVDTGGNDTVRAGDGNDGILLYSGTNEAFGDDGNDLIIGGFDRDTLDGGSGNDVIVGDVSTFLGQADRIIGGADDDLLAGGIGADVFVFATNDGNDTIAKIDLDYADYSQSAASGSDFQSGVDKVHLDGFGYSGTGEAFGHVTDVAGTATFSDQGTTITFFGLTKIDLSADDFFLL